MTPETIYYFILEVADADLKSMRRIFRHKGTIRNTGRLLNPIYMAEFDSICGHEIFELQTRLSLQEILSLIYSGEDLHYAYETINTPENFTGDRTYSRRH